MGGGNDGMSEEEIAKRDKQRQYWDLKDFEDQTGPGAD